MLSCDSEIGFQNLHVRFREDSALFQAKAQISSGVLLLLYSDKAPVCLLYGLLKGANSTNTSVSF